MSEQITPNPSVPTQVVAEVKFPKFISNLGIIPTSYKDSMDYYENLAWFCKFLEETVIPTVNQNGNAVQELQNLYEELNSYVTNYFENLDVQEEINNKLDEMASSGEFLRVLDTYFNNLEENYNYQISQFKEEVNSSLELNEAQILMINDKVESVASGTPAGVYSTLLALTTADPDHSKIYVVADSGKWYYYNEGWVEGGNYQASVNLPSLDDLKEKMDTLLVYTQGTYVENNNIVLPITLKNGDKLKIETTGTITVWTHSSPSNLEQYDVQRIGYITPEYRPNVFDITANASYIRIYASTEGTVKATVLGKKIEVMETNIATNSANIEVNETNIQEITDNFLIKYNLISELNENSFYSCWVVGQVPTLESSNNYGCGIADVHGLQYISTNGNVDTNFSCYADADHKKISKITDYRVEGKTNVYTVPENAYYAYWTNHGDGVWSSKGLVLIGKDISIDNPAVDVDEYPYGEKNYYADNMKLSFGYTLGEALNNDTFSHVFHIEKDGSGDYDKLIDGITEAVKYKNSIVYVGNGEWDIIDEYGETEIETMNQYKRGLYLKNGIRLICSPKSKIVANYTGTNNTVREWFSCFNAGEYGFTLENATIETSNIRYAIHDERDESTDFYINKYINCNIKHTNGFYAPCIGGGLGINGYIIIKDCMFTGTVVSDPIYLVSYHNCSDGAWDDSASKGAKSFLDIDGNYFNNTGSIRLLNMGKSTLMTEALVHNNSIGSAILHTNNDTLFYQANIEMKSYCNELRT